MLGPRGAGKTFFINNYLKEKASSFQVDLLNNDLRKKYLHDPGQIRKEIDYLFEKRKKLHVFIDEIQKVPELLDEIHAMIEKYQQNCIFILTGSSARKIKKTHTNMLAGRALFVHFYPFTSQEIDFNIHLEKILQFGTLPKAFLEEDTGIISRYLSTYTDTYLRQEILDEALSRRIDEFSRFLELAAFENGKPVNYSKLAKQINISDKTVSSHFQILEDSLIATRIPAWTFSARKQLQKSAKYFFFDNGLLNSLTGELHTELRPGSYRYGRLFENLIVNEIIRINNMHNYNYKLYHYRTNHGEEIDLILQKTIKTNPVAVEIKSAAIPAAHEVKALSAFKTEFPQSRCYVLCRTDTAYKDNGITFLPFAGGVKEIFQ